MFYLDKFIAENVTFRPVSMFAADIEANREKLTAEVRGKNDWIFKKVTEGGSDYEFIAQEVLGLIE